MEDEGGERTGKRREREEGERQGGGRRGEKGGGEEGWKKRTGWRGRRVEWRKRGRRREREEKQAGEVYTEKTGKKRCLVLSFMDAGNTAQAVSLTAEGTATPRGSLKRIVILPLCKSPC